MPIENALFNISKYADALNISGVMNATCLSDAADIIANSPAADIITNSVAVQILKQYPIQFAALGFMIGAGLQSKRSARVIIPLTVAAVAAAAQTRNPAQSAMLGLGFALSILTKFACNACHQIAIKRAENKQNKTGNSAPIQEEKKEHQTSDVQHKYEEKTPYNVEYFPRIPTEPKTDVTDTTSKPDDMQFSIVENGQRQDSDQ